MKKKDTIWDMAGELAKMTIKGMTKAELEELDKIIPDLTTKRRIR